MNERKNEWNEEGNNKWIEWTNNKMDWEQKYNKLKETEKRDKNEWKKKKMTELRTEKSGVRTKEIRTKTRNESR